MYNQLKQSMNLSDHPENLLEDDDPNDDINSFFTTKISKPENIGNSQLNIGKSRLLNSIKNIDDDFISSGSLQTKNTIGQTKVKGDDDFDFYK